MNITRRQTLQGLSAAALGAVAPFSFADAARDVTWKKLPRWRGFNLLQKFMGESKPFNESDFQVISDWGFDFARLPLDYRMWTSAEDPHHLNEKILAEIDAAVEFGKKHGVHVCLNLHRAPGYTVAEPKEKLSLWKDALARELFEFQWGTFAKRYRGIPAAQLSFNLINEPAGVDAATYTASILGAINAIHKTDPQRLVIADGIDWGTKPVPQLVPLQVAQATRGYDPFNLTHYKTPWAPVGGQPVPTWPMTDGDLRDRAGLLAKYQPWKELQNKGVGVICGQFGAYSHTPHDVVMRWMTDLLGVFKELDFGWCLWNLNGTFGVLDSEREDVKYEEFHGHKLDKQMLELLRSS